VIDPRLADLAAAHPFPLLFASLSGAHLYGFPSPDSDFDLRGVHVLPISLVAGLEQGPDTIERSGIERGLDLDLVTHDLAKFCRLMLRPNGYVLEQLFSPLVVQTSKAHAELQALGRRCITRRHVLHYLGFAHSQWQLFERESPRRVKPLLYVYRVLLTGMHLLRTGEVEADLRVLNQSAGLSQVDELVARKVGGVEQGVLTETDSKWHEREYARLRAELEAAGRESRLPEAPTARQDLQELVLRLRREGVQ
jgi:predicted nucleotidyltransferase